MLGSPFSKLRARLGLVIAAAALPGLLLAAGAAVSEWWSARERARADMLLTSRLASANHDRLVELTRQFLATLGHLPEVRGQDTEGCSSLLAGLLHQHRIYTDIGRAAPDGTVVCSGLPAPGRAARRPSPFVSRVLQSRAFAVGDVGTGGIPPRVTLPLASPLFSDAGAVQGILYADLDLSWLREFAEETSLPPGGAFTLLDAEGTVLAHHPDGAAFIGRRTDAPVARAVRAGGEGVSQLGGVDGAERLYAFTPLRGQGGERHLYAAVGVPAAQAYGAADRRLAYHLAATGIALLLSVLGAWGAGTVLVVRRVRRLLAHTSSLAAGDHGLRTGLATEAGALGQLAREFDDMAGVLQRRQREMDVAHQESRQSQALKIAILEGALDGVITMDAEGRIVEFNPAAEATFGYPREQVLGAPVESLIVPVRFRKEGAGGLHYLATADEIAHRRRVERLAMRADGTEFPVEIAVTPIEGGGGPPLFTAFLRDITERRRAEEALRTARDELQKRVESRTVELKEANERLVDWVEELQARAQDMRLLSELGDHLQACQTVEEAYAVLSQYGSALFPEEPGALCMLSEGHPLVECVASWGTPPPAADVFTPDDCWALRRGRPHVVDGGESPLGCRHVGDPPPAAYVCVPLMAQGTALGLLHLVEAKPRTGSGEMAPHHALAHRQLAFTVADRMALAVSNLRLQAKLRDQAIRDGLTGLFNRRYMQESLEREMRRAERRETTLGVIMLDIDHFKRFNDTFGHAAGDVLLRHVGSLLQSHTRGEDIACRYGGEEFLLILLDATPADTEQRAERLRDEASQLKIEHGKQQLGDVTISLGVAIYPEHAGDGESLLKAADAALYRAKESGRNRVIMAGQPTEAR